MTDTPSLASGSVPPPPPSRRQKRSGLWADVALYGAACVVSVVSTFVAFLERTCQQGDWLTCSGEITYSPLGSVLRVVAVVAPVAVILVNFLVLDAGRGSLGMRRAGLRVVDNATGVPVAARRRVLRAVLNTALLSAAVAVAATGVVGLLFLVLIEYAFSAGGRRRMLDWVLRTDLRETA